MRRAMAARSRRDIPDAVLDAGRAGSNRFYFCPEDMSRCEQTHDAVSSNLVADGIGVVLAVTSAWRYSIWLRGSVE